MTWWEDTRSYLFDTDIDMGVLAWRRDTKETDVRHHPWTPYAYHYRFPRCRIVQWVASRYTRMLIHKLKKKDHIFIRLNLKDPCLLNSLTHSQDLASFATSQMERKERIYLDSRNHLPHTDYTVFHLKEDLYLITKGIPWPKENAFRALLKEIHNAT